MRNDKLIPGLVLVMIGAAFLLHNFHILNFHWYNIIHLWPIFLVIGGVNLVFAHNKSPWAIILKVAVVVAGFGLLFFANFDDDSRGFWQGFRYNYHDDHNSTNNSDDDGDMSDSTSAGSGKSESFNEPFVANSRYAKLNVSGGGTTYTLSDTTNQLFSADTKSSFGGYDFTHHQEDSTYVLDFRMKNHNGFHFDSDKAATTIRLNLNPIWEINVEAGATKLDFNLSKFKVKKLKIDGGAASFNIKLGQPLAETNVDISTGVSGVDIDIPQNAACRVTTDSGLSDNHFEGFVKKDDGTYESAGFDAAKNKMRIHISGGLSGFKVRRY